MKKKYLKSYENYRPSITQRIEQFFRCRKNKHLWRIYDVVENGEVVGEYKECIHCRNYSLFVCGENYSSFNVL